MLDHPYASLLPLVERPGRYVGGEFGAAPAPERADSRIALAFPDAYEIGTSHIGLAVLYQIVNAAEGLSAERVFMPWPDMEALLRERGLPLVSLESARPLGEFDIVGFSLQYELTYTNLIAMLELGRIPVRSGDRRDGDPIVIAGGPLAAQSEPLARFLDLVLVGDGEEDLPRLMRRAADLRAEGRRRSEMVEALGGMASVYAPGLLETSPDPRSGRRVVAGSRSPSARRAIAPVLAGQPAGRGPVPAVGSVFDRYSVEIARGCAEGCRFCQAGFLYRPVRERSEGDVARAAREAVFDLGFDEISLAALSSADHSRIGPIVETLGDLLTPERVSLSVPSLRAYGLSDEVVEVLGRLRATGVTLAPEAGSQRLRDAINKNVTEDDLRAAAARFFDRGFHRIKLYFMLGLPGERDEDLEEIVRLAAGLRELGEGRSMRRRPAISASVSTFVPKPFTPFEREPMIGAEELLRRQSLLTRLARRARISLKLHDRRQSRLEALFSRGDRDLADPLERAVALGARYDGWGDMFSEGAWIDALEGVDVDGFLGPIPDGARVPWDHVDVGVDGSFLSSERDRSRRGDPTPPCGVFEGLDGGGEKLVCHGCGLACRAEEMPVRMPRVTTSVVGSGTGAPPPPEDPRGLPPQAGAAVKVRFEIAMWGCQAFVGHLDTVRQIARSLRRAGLEIVYTRGFHPKPKLESGPALPVGTAGLGELFDVWLADPPPERDMLERLAGATPSGLEFVGARAVAPSERSLGERIEGAEHVSLAAVDPGVAAESVSRFLAADVFEADRVRKKRRTRVDLKKLVREIRVLDGTPVGLRLPPAADRTAIATTLELPGSGGVRPQEVLAALLGPRADGAWTVRTRILLGPEAPGSGFDRGDGRQ